MNYFKYYSECIDKVLTLKQVKLVFLLALRDFVSGKITSKYFTSIANHLYYNLSKPSDFYSNNKLHALGEALESASELNYYKENKEKEETSAKMYSVIVKNLESYLNENKKLLKDIDKDRDTT